MVKWGELCPPQELDVLAKVNEIPQDSAEHHTSYIGGASVPRELRQTTGLIVHEHQPTKFGYDLTTVWGRAIKVFIDHATHVCHDG